MMMGNMGLGMFWAALLTSALLSGFAFVVWVLASKEEKNLKLIGQVIAGIIAVFALVILLYVGVYGGIVCGRGGASCGMGGGMMEHKMGDAKMKMMMEKMMKDPEMKKLMEGSMKGTK